MDADQTSVDRESVLQCPEHSLPLNFYSDKEQIYKCIKCLINEKEVHFVDHSYKGHLERFKKIQATGYQVMEENKHMPYLISEWKGDIRDMLLRVRAQMIEYIDNFTNRFIQQISKIEERKELSAFIGEDARQSERMSELEKKLDRINQIMKTIDETPPNLKSEVTKTFS